MSATTAMAINTAAAGALAGYVSTGTTRGALQGGISAALFFGAGEIAAAAGANSVPTYFAHATAGCLSALSGGGDCGNGAAGAVFGKFTSSYINNNQLLSGDVAKGVATVVAGGVGSVLAGGKFENGATTAAFGYLFNQLQHQNALRELKADIDYAIETGGCMRTPGPDICVGPGSIKSIGDKALAPLIRTEAKNLAEQLTVQEAQAGAGRRIMQGQINDPRYPANQWAKMQHMHQTPTGHNIVIHYWERLKDSFRTGFKFKD